MKPILDACCGSKMFWFDKENPLALFADIRNEEHTLCDGRVLKIAPDIVQDFRKMDFQDNTFHMVVFDPPHLLHAGQNSWLGKKYGILSKNWQDDIRKGFEECFRVLKPYGTLIFKWSDVQVSTAAVLKTAPCKPLFGHRRGKTVFLVFMKTQENSFFWNTRVYPKEVQEAIEKQKPKKPQKDIVHYRCPNCDAMLNTYETCECCNHCGQKLDWSE